MTQEEIDAANNAARFYEFIQSVRPKGKSTRFYSRRFTIAALDITYDVHNN